MKYLTGIVRQANHWLALLLLTDLVFIFLVWLLRPGAFKSIVLFILLFTGILTSMGLLLQTRQNDRIAHAAREFFSFPCQRTRDDLLAAAGKGWVQSVDLLFSKLTMQEDQINDKTSELCAYREYIEAWVHEIKTPLSLSTLVLYNHKGDMTPYVYGRMNYVQHELNEHVERILHYARIQAEHTDLKYTRVRLDTCVEEAISRYRALAEERRIAIDLKLQPLTVISDQRAVSFILSQLLSNAMKYGAADDPQLSVLTWQEGDSVFLAVRNNGKGVPPEDAPFLFDKGFTGSHPDRPSATGMGLYLVKKYADKLGAAAELEQVCTTGRGFGIRIVFKL